MLTSTYLHCAGVGPTTEQRLWAAGASTWADLLRAPGDLPVGPRLRDALCEVCAESLRRLEARDARWFARQVPTREHWRAFREFRARVAYVDIETTGGMEPEDLTTVGLYDGSRLHQFVRGDNLDEFPEAVERADVIVTFFGTGFDLPFLRRAFRMEFPQLHVDLCPLLRRLGYTGGLKRVEEALGIRRPDETRGMDGLDAVRLWWRWVNYDDEGALHKLLAYNAEDVINLERLIDLALPALLEKAGVEAGGQG
jgi:uncharacterized protein